MGLSRFAKYAWGALVYDVIVVLWGAYVRATGSGAGCGSHWPLCQGVVVPQSPATATLIEFTHRISTGLVLVFAAGMLYWAWRAYPRGHRVRTGSLLVLAFTLVDALIGAVLVLYGLVAQNTSSARAISVAAHLANTFLLLGSLALTAAWASGAGGLRLRGRGWPVAALGVGLLGAMVIGVTGAITALGDTLFPSTFAAGVQQDFSPTAHFLIRLRVYHPVVAVLVGIYLIGLVSLLRSGGYLPISARLGRLLTGLVIVQLAAGAVNVVLAAPVWMQMLHLLLADSVWITLVLLAGLALAERPSVTGAPVSAAPRSTAAATGVLRR